MDPIVGVVLSGGRSRRMGRDKAMLPHRRTGETFLRLAVTRLGSLCDPVVVCVPPGGPPQALPELRGVAKSPVIWLADPVSHQGPSVGIASALGWASRRGHPACLVTPVDMPGLSAEDLQRLVRLWRGHPDRVVCALDETADRVQPLVAIYPAAAHRELLALAQSEDRSLRRWLARRSPLAVPLSADALTNINRPEDLGENAGSSEVRPP